MNNDELLLNNTRNKKKGKKRNKNKNKNKETKINFIDYVQGTEKYNIEIDSSKDLLSITVKNSKKIEQIYNIQLNFDKIKFVTNQFTIFYSIKEATEILIGLIQTKNVLIKEEKGKNVLNLIFFNNMNKIKETIVLELYSKKVEEQNEIDKYNKKVESIKEKVKILQKEQNDTIKELEERSNKKFKTIKEKIEKYKEESGQETEALEDIYNKEVDSLKVEINNLKNEYKKTITNIEDEISSLSINNKNNNNNNNSNNNNENGVNSKKEDKKILIIYYYDEQYVIMNFNFK